MGSNLDDFIFIIFKRARWRHYQCLSMLLDTTVNVKTLLIANSLARGEPRRSLLPSLRDSTNSKTCLLLDMHVALPTEIHTWSRNH